MAKRRGKSDGEGHESAGGRIVLVVVTVLAVLAGGAYVAAYAGAGNDVPRGVTVLGVDIGGMTPERAEQVLRERLGPELQEPVPVTAEDQGSAEVDPVEAGLAVDWTATVEAAGGGRSWAPADLWDHYTGGEKLDPVPLVDPDALDSTFERLDERLGTEAKDGAVWFSPSAEVRTRDPKPGREVDRDAGEDALVDAWLDGEDAPAQLPLAETTPDIDADDVQDALDEVANPAVSAPVTLVFDGSPVKLEPRQFVGALAFKPQQGELAPIVKRKELSRQLGDVVATEDEPVDASFEIVDGQPKVVPGKPGADYDPEVIARNFLRLVKAEPGDRRLEVEAEVVRPDLTTKEARQLGIKEQVSSFTTSYPHADYRNTNIGRAAELADGTILEPGEVFSMNDIVGERTAERGFTEGFIISDGILTQDLGGGVSQLATTLFNAMFFAGLEDVEHKPHSFYISRYPVGREATVVFGAVDLRFRNDTDYGVLVKSGIDPSTPGTEGSVTVTMYSTEVWDIESITSERYNFTSPETRRIDDPSCEPNSGYGGFDIDVTRVFRRPGSSEVVERETFNTTYTPSDTVICE